MSATVKYGRLSPQARDTIRWRLAGISTIAGFVVELTRERPGVA